MTNFSNKFLIPLENVSKKNIEAHQIWEDLNKGLENAVKEFVLRAKKSSFPLKINLERFKSAVGIYDLNARLGLVFKDKSQQDRFVSDFETLMRQSGYTSFSLVATGSSFQGLSTNPKTYKELGYMKFCGENGKTDLDLQIYCQDMLQKAIEANRTVFRDHFEVEEVEEKKYAKLTTFNNKDNPQNSAPYCLEPGIIDFENRWTEKLQLNFQGTGVVFEGISVALMTKSNFRQLNTIGTPYKLIDYD